MPDSQHASPTAAPSPSPSTTPPLPALTALSRALTYPYPRPSHSYLFPPTANPPPPLALDLHLSALTNPNLSAVLAVGSNAAPSQLARKFGPDTTPIPVLAIRVSRLDAVHAALIASYGSVAATAAPSLSPDAALLTHATLLTPAQFRRMNDTEGGYFLVRLHSHLVAPFDTNDPAAHAAWASRPCFAYVARNGPMLRDDRVVPLSDLRAEARVLPSCNQAQAQLIAQEVAIRRGIVSPLESVQQFIQRNIDDDARRVRIVNALKEEWAACDAATVDGPWEVCKSLGPNTAYETCAEAVVVEQMGIHIPTVEGGGDNADC